MRQLLKDLTFFAGTSVMAAFLLVTCTIPVQAEPFIKATGLFCISQKDLDTAIAVLQQDDVAKISATIDPLLRRYECIHRQRDEVPVGGFIVYYGRTFDFGGETYQIVGLSTYEDGEAELYSFFPKSPPKKGREI
jgi:hypothetical protein